jgi:hypothetical protein
MLLRIGIGAMLATVVLMFWGFVFWEVLAVPDSVLRPLPAGESLVRELRQSPLTTGVYLAPYPPRGPHSNTESWAAFDRQRREGPLVHLFYSRGGSVPDRVTTYARGMLLTFSAAFLAGCLLSVVAPRLGSYAARAGFVLLLGLFATCFVNLMQPVWFHHPWGYHFMMAVFDCSNALLLGLVLAWFVRPGVQAAWWTLDGK